MPINAFGGGPGTGKTYGVVEHVILPAVAKGRFVLTNIDGLNTDAIYQYVVDNFYTGKIFCIGHIRTCSRGRPGEDGFFPGDDSLDKPCHVPAANIDVVVGGDLVVIDEATRYWPMGEKVSKEAQFFFREHRHFANVLGHTCDLVVIDPDLMLLSRPLRGKIELSSVTHKPKALGMNRYTVRMYRGCKLTAKPQSVSGPFPFKPEVYALYKSYSHEGAKESAVDSRQNIFRNKLLWLYVAVIVGIGGSGFWYTWKYFNPDKPKAMRAGRELPVRGSSTAGPAVAVQGSTAAVSFSDRWRVVGSYSGASGSWVVLADPAGRLRLESPSAFAGAGVAQVGEVDGLKVTRFSGVPVVVGGSAVGGR